MTDGKPVVTGGVTGTETGAAESGADDRSRLHQTGDVLIIMVENSYEGTVRREDGRFLSSKAEMRKGIGITSVLDVCKKYNGIPKIEYNGSLFKVSILLNGISK